LKFSFKKIFFFFVFSLKLYPLIEQIVKLYPQSIVYPFKLSYETLQHSITDPILKHNLELIHQKLDYHTPLVNEFIQALNQLNPQQQFESWCKEFYQLLTTDRNTRDLSKLKNHLKIFKETLFSDTINLDETNETHPLTTTTSQDSVFGDGTDHQYDINLKILLKKISILYSVNKVNYFLLYY
jgi:hypothetical protein